ncbi:acyl-CoA dehydrogenase family protein [Streptomyces sp. NPDC055721]|uniref:acyl-CoA dehydrogenase family protein n=1 Tax=Streptomyces sp. NPDC127132 TaxID=3345374 RepID=UPI0036397FEB
MSDHLYRSRAGHRRHPRTADEENVMNRTSPHDTAVVSMESTRAELVAQAVALQPLLREQAARGDADRVIPAGVVDALADADVFRLLTPRRFGGRETDLRTLTEVTEALGEGDGSAAWVGMIIAVTNWLACLFPEEAQEEVFGADPDARVTGVAAPMGLGEPVQGGWRVSGTWPYNSGAPFATWAAVGALLKDAGGAVVDQALVLIPTSDLTIEDTWHTVGMRGTASNTLMAHDVVVPEHRVLSVPAASEGSYPHSRDEALYGSTFGPMLLLCLLGPLLGVGNAALRSVMGDAATKPLSFTVHSRQADSVGVQIQLADAALKLETARLHTYRAADEVDRAARAGRSLDYAARTHIRARAGYAAQQVLDAITTLLNAHGASGFADDRPLQRLWRDANVAARHAGLVPAVGLEVYGKSLLGLDERVSLMV